MNCKKRNHKKTTFLFLVKSLMRRGSSSRSVRISFWRWESKGAAKKIAISALHMNAPSYTHLCEATNRVYNVGKIIEALYLVARIQTEWSLLTATWWINFTVSSTYTVTSRTVTWTLFGVTWTRKMLRVTATKNYNFLERNESKK